MRDATWINIHTLPVRKNPRFWELIFKGERREE
jgi:hypothetical protein